MARRVMATRNSDSGFLSKIFKNALGNPLVRNVTLATTVAVGAIGGVAVLNDDKADQAVITNIETSDGKEIIIEMDDGKSNYPKNFRVRVIDAETIQESGLAEKIIDINDLFENVNVICNKYGGIYELRIYNEMYQKEIWELDNKWREGSISKEELSYLISRGDDGLSAKFGRTEELLTTDWYLDKILEAVNASNEISDTDKNRIKKLFDKEEYIELDKRGNPSISCPTNDIQ